MSAFRTLHDYLLRRMRMSHVADFPFFWGPVMIQALLEGGGVRTERDIARALMAFDVSQVEYYEIRTRDMVSHVLRNFGVAVRGDQPRDAF